MVFVAGADHPLAQQGSATMEEILQYPLVQYKADVNEGTLQLFRQYRRDPELLYIDDFNSLWRLPQIGPYLFLSPALALGSQDRERLRPVHIRDLDYHGTISWVHSQAPLSPAEQAVVSALEAASARLQQEIG